MITVLTHDPKFDVPLLEVALRLPEVAYVGAMGSRRTHEDRLDRLREAGVDDKEIERLSSPIGLDLGARTPEETAVSIAAEIIAGRWGGSGERLAARDGRIHRSSVMDGISLNRLADEHLGLAARARQRPRCGDRARGREHHLRQTLIALLATRLAD